MSIVKQLKDASSIKDLATIFGIEAKGLSYLLYFYAGPKYKTFQVAKKSGGFRTIEAPIDRLKVIQRLLLDLLTKYSAEIEEKRDRKPLSHGFRKGRSIITNSRPHTGRRFVLNLDIEDFFPTFNFGRVRGFFLKDKDFELKPRIATVIAQIACNGHTLPQGSPCSPIISDLIAHILDVRLVRLAAQNRCTYSRYADDLTFSTNEKEFPTALANCSADGLTWTLGDPLIATIINAGFTVNPAKTRMQCRASRQMVTGLVVNKKVNVRDEYVRSARSMCYALFKTGSYHLPGSLQPLSKTHRIEGVLNHIDQIRTNSDAREDIEKKLKPLASRKLYERFIFFKNCVVPERPFIICEGPSDAIYLKTAIHQLAGKYPDLIDTAPKIPKLKIRFFSYRKRATALLGLMGGTAHMKPFLESYEKQVDSFGYKPLSSPVILLLDNDSGTKSVFPFINGKYKLNASLKTTAPFYYICQNLYVVKTPEQGDTGDSMIEDCFEAALLQTPYNGKLFNPDDDKLGPNEFGKVALAGIVRSEAEKINFAGFEPLLDRLVAAVKDYESLQAKP